jgi:hypothetical protein
VVATILATLSSRESAAHAIVGDGGPSLRIFSEANGATRRSFAESTSSRAT